MTEPVRWGILGTARIASTAFLPAIRAAGARPIVVGGRDPERSQQFAGDNGVERVAKGYQAVVEDTKVEAIYIPLPNSLHGEWTIAALQAGKAVLCEKPLCGDLAEAESVLSVAAKSSGLLWEAFVFPFHRQQQRLWQLAESGAIGRIREIHSQFHFLLTNPTNIRLDPDLGGGALLDVGCYPIRFAQLMFNASPITATATASYSDRGVDVELQGVLSYPEGCRLLMACGMRQDLGTFSRVIGDEGEIRISNPFHAREFDTVEISTADGSSVEHLGSEEPSFTDAIRHISAVLRDKEQPAHTALKDSLATELAMDLVKLSAETEENGEV